MPTIGIALLVATVIAAGSFLHHLLSLSSTFCVFSQTHISLHTGVGVAFGIEYFIARQTTAG